MQYPLSQEEIRPYRPMPFFFITSSDPADLTPEKTEQSLRQLKDCGFGGFVLFNKAYTSENYLSDDWFDMVRNFAAAAKKLSLTMWINDGFDFPPGNVAGQVEKIAPELKQQRITKENGQLTVKTVDWGFPAFEHPKSGQLFIELVYERYKKEVGQYFGDPIVGFFSDADNRRIFPSVMYDENDPAWDYFPWTDDFAESFRAAYGYDILEHMDSVLARESTDYARDYWEHAGRMYHRWFAGNHAWLQKHNLLYTGHTSDSSPFLYHHAPRSSCFSEGRFSDLERNFDFPGTDQEMLAIDTGKHLRRESMYQPHALFGRPLAMRMKDYFDMTHDTRAKQAGSTAFMYSKQGVMCEMFAASNFGVSPEELTQISTFQIMQGVTFVVPHAYHYRFNGDIKYFAPPEFSDRGMIGHAIRPLNQSIAELTCMMSKGKSLCPVALLDPTDAVWKNDFDEEAFFSAFVSLNRLPYGYVICHAEKVTEGNLGFQVAVAAGFQPDDETRTKLQEKGIALIDENQLDKLGALIPCNISYTGTGTPHFVRKEIDGEEFVFVANVENAEAVTGTLRAYGREKQISLLPGDVIYLSASYDNIPQAEPAGTPVCQLPETLPAVFLDKNLLPMEWFAGCAVKTEDVPQLTFPFTCAQALDGITAYIPSSQAVSGVMLDGKELSGTACMVYDDPYFAYSLGALTPGDHSLVICKTAPLAEYDRLFLAGEFDVAMEGSDTPCKVVLNIYNMKVSVPETLHFTLSPRRNTLSTKKSWALQGQTFYSGQVRYQWDVTLPADGAYRLVLPRVRDVVTLSVDGRDVGTRIRRPYHLTFAATAGEHTLTLLVANSLANQMECYAEESGILQGGYLEQI